jgi:hypothetical protein
MNLRQIITRVMRIFGRKGANGSSTKPAGAASKRVPDIPGSAGHTASARDTAKRARRAAKVTRRGGR